MLWALVLLGVFVTGLLDHYWWTAPPGMLAVATALGFWASAQSPMIARPPLPVPGREGAGG
jgi:hypothetical protein